MPTPDLPDPPGRPPPRYWPDEGFPPYRYVPLGRHPHPTMDDGGHMRTGRPAIPDDAPSELAWMTNRWWLYGVDLYNHWYFWEATETWEPLWRRLDKQSPEGQFLQALMMLNGLCLKVQCQETEGVVAFWQQARERLERVAGARKTLWGLPVKKTLKAWQGFMKPLDKKGTLPVLDKGVPFLKLPM